MTDLERSLHDVLHSLSGAMKAAEEEKKGVEGQDLPLYMFYHSVRVDLGEIQGRVGKLLRIIEDNNKKEEAFKMAIKELRDKRENALVVDDLVPTEREYPHE